VSDARTEIFARIRRGSSGASAEAVAAELAGIGPGPAAALPCDEPCTAFLTNILKNQGTVAIAKNRSETVKAVADYLYQRYRSHKIVAGSDQRLAALPWRDAGLLPRFGAAGNGEPAALSYARLGIVETGSVVTFTGKANPASNNLLAEDHIVIVHTDDLAVTLDQAWLRINAAIDGQRPRGINIISGPSSTADIAMHMVMGAHGPRRWHVILAGDVTADALAQAHQLSGVS
jgi:L-lactate dehydrogenase complex protein LldG